MLQQRKNPPFKAFFVGTALLVLLVTCGNLVSQTTLLSQFSEEMYTIDTAEAALSFDDEETVSRIDETETVTTMTEAMLERMKMYKERYKYKPPTPYNKHADRDELCGVSPNYDTFFSREGVLERSANEEDKKIYELLFKPTGEKDGDGDGETIPATRGYIVEMGAFDGIRESNSRLFDTCLGWDTLLIEGNPINWEKLVNNRPHAHRFSFAPSCSEEDELMNKTIKFDYHPWTNAGLADGSVTTAFSEKKDHKTADVPCGSLTKVLLDVFPAGHVSFFSLDVEGAEPLVLENIEFDKVFIEVLMVENWNTFCTSECETRDKFQQIMNDNGYEIFKNAVQKSDLFIHPRSQHLETMRKKGIKPSEY